MSEDDLSMPIAQSWRDNRLLPELEAMQQMLIALKPLNREDQLRVLRAAAVFFNIELDVLSGARR